ncbi:MAG TPA: 5-methyltetrahydropteroyltriglutamate--homocysteine S-methyltransferase [Xanthobacteraceae bacterium]|nr:5-methyltetrahydropteroyltriglutamate--homocysteine S-methyltransferase [Xanthobacteraceae bacterium]
MASSNLAEANQRTAASQGKPSFRSDQVGSLLRPQQLKDAREQHEAGKITAEQLRTVEDDCIRAAVRLQETAGLYALTDGDFRRSAFHVDFLTRLEGVVWRRRQFTNLFHGLEKDSSPLVFEVTGKIRHKQDISVPDFTFLHGLTKRTAKVALPAPSFVHARGGRDAIDKTAYPDLAEFYDDLAAAFRAEIHALGQAGCRYVQLDEVHYTFFCDPKLVEMFTSRGDDPQDLALKYARLINDSFRGRHKDMVSGVHLCRGNRRSAWVASGGYEPVAEVLFNEIDADRFLLEFDDERSGGFEPLRFVPKGKMVVLGLVSSKTSQMETRDGLKRRIEEAARYMPIEQIALSPQCGFASSVAGNIITEDAQWAKLELISQVAEDIWGTSA